MKKVTAILLGAGQRGAEAYASYALDYPNELKFVGVAEPREDRREEFRRLHGVKSADTADSWEKLLERPRMADCVLICTQDQMHYQAIKMAAERGYHILCEKPISPDRSELEEIGKMAAEYRPVFSICHVLRYSPFFREIHRLLEEGAIGELVDIQHMESVGYWHMAHSFVRGNWRSRRLSSPMILQKCCHDMDILLWLAGSSCRRISSFGGLTHFKKENAPENAPANCLEGCRHREECPYFAPRFYLEDMEEKGGTFARVVSMKQDRASLLQALQEGPYGRCVYRCDNDVVDHQVVNLEFENGVTASLTMCAFTARCERVINLMGTRGQIRGNMEENRIVLEDFASGRRVVTELKVPKGGHSGSDVSMMKDFVDLISSGGGRESVSAARESVESHLMALAAEESRLNGGRVCEMNENRGVQG